MKFHFRYIFKFIIITNFCFSYAVASESTEFGIIDHFNNADHIDLGYASDQKKNALPFFPSRATTGKKLNVTADMFEKPEVCGGCHKEIYSQWKGSMHSNAWTDPIYRAALKLADKGTKGKVTKLCIGCHSPIGLVTGTASPDGEGMSEMADAGVQCDVCHNISASSGIGNGAYQLTPELHGKKLKFGPFKDAQSPYHDTAYSKLHTKSAFCGQCHNVTHPFNQMPIERTYDEWKDSWYAGQGIECQDCHMTPGPGVTRNPGRATPTSKKRKQIYTHYFVGGNTMVTKMFGADEHSRQAEEMLRAAATIDIITNKNWKKTGLQKVSVKVTNVGAGHKLPTGFPEGREMWLDIKITDATGKEIFRSGKVEHGRTEPETKSFKVILGDKDNNVVDLELWTADKVLSDTRIPAKSQSTVDYHLILPTDTNGPLNISVDLNYWSFPQAIINHLMGENAPIVPITNMAKASKVIQLGSKSLAQR